MQDMERIISEVGEIVANFGDGAITEVMPLMDAKDRLVALCYTLGNEVANAKGEHLRGYFNRKYMTTRKKRALMDKGAGVGKAEIEANDDPKVIRLLQTEVDAEITVGRYEILLRQANKVVDAMTQRISFLRKEYENT